MGIPNYTTVVGVDTKYFEQFKITWPTWRHHKPSLLDHPMIVFHEETIKPHEIKRVVDHPNLTVQKWPMPGVVYGGDSSNKWTCLQRNKMLAGFVHVPAMLVLTRYWLKLDVDVVAQAKDSWIDPNWFEDSPAIIAPPWGYTKPANQMEILDRWADYYQHQLPLTSAPPETQGKDVSGEVFRHKRIASWCAFFNTQFSIFAASVASATVGTYQIPVPSQDGYLYYCAKRWGYEINRVRMQSHGWSLGSHRSLKEKAKESLNGESSVTS